MTSKAYKKQIGGSHYKDMVLQPSEFINKNRLPFAEGSAIKYICRHSAKGKEQETKFGRDFYKGGMKYKNPPIPKDVIGFDLYVNWSLPIILVEGVFDAMSVKSNSIPLFGKTILPKLYGKIVEKKVSDIFIILDSDAFNDAIQMVEKFTDNGISVNFVKLDGQDPNDLGYKKMITKINNSLPMDFKQIMEMKLYGKKLLAN